MSETQVSRHEPGATQYYLNCWRFVVSIVRIGLAETKHFSDGYAAIFGGKKKESKATAKKAKKPAKAKKKSKK